MDVQEYIKNKYLGSEAEIIDGSSLKNTNTTNCSTRQDKFCT